MTTNKDGTIQFKQSNSSIDASILSRFNEHDQYFEHLDERMRKLEKNDSKKSETLDISELNSLERVIDKYFKKEKDDIDTKLVSFYAVQRVLSLSVGLVSILALASWIITEVPVLNPFVATMALAFSPFMYWMSKIKE